MRALRIFLVAFVLLGLAPPAQAFSLANFDNDLVRFLLEQVSVEGEFEIQAEDIIDSADGGTELRGVKIADASGVWFEARSFIFTWEPSRLLKGEVEIGRLALDGARMHRLPSGNEVSAVDDGEAEESDFSWPRSPITLFIRKLAITDMLIAEGVLPQALAFDALGAVRDEGDEQSLALKITRTDAIEGIIDLAYLKRFDQETFKLDLDAREAAGGLVAALADLPGDVPVSLTLNADGPPSNWQGKLASRVTDFFAVDGMITARWADRIGGDFTLAVETGPRLDDTIRLPIGEKAEIIVSADENDDGVIVLKEGRLVGSAMTASATGSFDRRSLVSDLAVEVTLDPEGAARMAPLLDPLSIGGGTVSITVQGPPDAIIATGRARVSDLAALDYGADAATVDFRVETQAADAAVTLAVDAVGPRGADAAVAKALGEAVRLRVDVAKVGDTVTLNTLALEAKSFTFSGDGTIALGDPVRPDLKYTLTAPDVGPLAAIAGLTASGSLNAEGRLAGAELPRATGILALTEAVIDGRSLGNLVVDHDVLLAEVISGQASAQLRQSEFGDGDIRTRFSAGPDRVALESLEADILGLQAVGSAVLPQGGGLPDAQLDVTIDTLSPLGTLASLSLQGEGKMAVRLYGDADASGAEPAGTLVLDGALEDLDVDGTRAARLALSGKVLEAVTRPAFDLSLNGAGMRAADLRADRITVTLKGPQDALAVTAQVNGQLLEKSLSMTTALQADLVATPGPVLTVSRLQAALAGETIRLARPATVTLSGAQVDIRPLALALPDGGSLAGAMTYDPTALEADLTLNGLPLRLANLFAETPVTGGAVSGSLKGRTGGAQVGLRGKVAIRGFTMQGAAEDAGAIDADIDAAWNGALLDLEGSVSGPVKPPLTMTARLPLPKGPGAFPGLPANPTVRAAVKWQGDIETLMELAPVSGHLLAGDTVIDVTAEGALTAPRLSGTVSLKNGRYENLDTGTILRDLALDTAFSDSRQVTFVLAGTDGLKGTVRSEGKIEMRADGPVFRIVTDVKNAILVRRDEATAETSIDLVVAGNGETMGVTGEVTVERAEIRLLNTTPPSVVDLGEVDIKGAPPRPKAEPAEGSRVNLAVDVLIPGKVFVRGRGLDSQWSGNLSITGTAANPIVVGRIESVQGVLDFIGRQFKLEKGQVVFGGTRDIDPVLDVRLAREAHGIVGRILVEGTAKSPKLTFASTPALSEDEVLPRVLFGQSKQSLSGLEALQLAAGIATLLNGEEGVVDRARAAVGVDVLRVEEGETADDSANLTVGKNVAEGVYVGTKNALDGSGTSVTVEIEVFDNITVDTELGNKGDTSAGINWRKDF
ncbi:MAG: translocation/assembly module TamB domain-containing protein [Magnetospiraceae bacterium]